MSRDLMVWGVVVIAGLGIAGVVWLIIWLNDRMDKDIEDK